MTTSHNGLSGPSAQISHLATHCLALGVLWNPRAWFQSTVVFILHPPCLQRQYHVYALPGATERLPAHLGRELHSSSVLTLGNTSLYSFLQGTENPSVSTFFLQVNYIFIRCSCQWGEVTFPINPLWPRKFLLNNVISLTSIVLTLLSGIFPRLPCPPKLAHTFKYNFIQSLRMQEEQHHECPT